MNIRPINPNDILKLQEIHQKHFGQEFIFPNFINEFHCAFVIENDNDEIITAGGVRAIAEAITITNKDFSVKIRREALHKMLQASLFTAGHHNYNQLHAFVQDPSWTQCLKKIGFKDTKGQSLVIDL